MTFRFREPTFLGRCRIMENEMPVSVVLHLVEHCIQTEALRALKHRQAMLLDDDSEQVDEETTIAELEMLKVFLESQDFPHLRASDPDLAGGRDVEVRVFRRADGSVGFEKLDR